MNNFENMLVKYRFYLADKTKID